MLLAPAPGRHYYGQQMARGRLPVAAVAAVVVVLVAAWSGSTRTQPAQTADPQVVPGATFVGARACAACHQEIHAGWTGGRHSKMIQPASPASVKGDFSTGSLTLRGGRFRLRSAGGQYFITESNITGTEQEHRVEFTLGSRRIQHYLTTIAGGKIIVLTPSWDVQRRQWFDNMEIVRPDENDQTPVQQWNKNCFGCHVSQQDNHYRPAAHTYATAWVDFGTSCERCHGPGSAHAERYTRAGTAPAAADHAIVRPTRLDPKTSSMICAQCHSLRDIIAPGYTAGANYFDYFQPGLEYGPRKASDPTYWADGRPRRFSNDALGLWQSACFVRGGATCTSCHRDPHVPDIDRNPQLAASNNALCTGCHQAIGAQLTAHTRHGEGSAGSSCVECHMPKAVMSIKATIRDHTISLPAPENTVRFAIPNACNQCHADKPPSWAVAVLDKWWPHGARGKFAARAEAFTGGRAGRPEALDRLIQIAADGTQGPLIQANAVGYLSNYAEPRALSALLAATRAEHPAIRAAAMSRLGTIDLQSAARRTALLSALDDPRRAVRIAALMALINYGGGPPDGEDAARFRRVSREFAARAQLHQDDATTQRDLGLIEWLAGDLDPAASALEIALGLDRDQPSAKFLMGMVRLGQRRFAEGSPWLKQVPPSDPYYAAAQARLKLTSRP
jgi:predicted CXXCH cytochrome family protein